MVVFGEPCLCVSMHVHVHGQFMLYVYGSHVHVFAYEHVTLFVYVCQCMQWCCFFNVTSHKSHVYIMSFGKYYEFCFDNKKTIVIVHTCTTIYMYIHVLYMCVLNC